MRAIKALEWWMSDASLVLDADTLRSCGFRRTAELTATQEAEEFLLRLVRRCRHGSSERGDGGTVALAPTAQQQALALRLITPLMVRS